MIELHSYNADEFRSRHGIADGNLMVEVSRAVGVSPGGPWMVGGSVRRFISGKQQDSDFDVGVASQAQLDSAKNLLVSSGFSLKKETDHYIELVGPISGKQEKIQILRNVIGQLPEILDSFDFTICQCAFDGENLIVGPFTMWDLGRKRLAIHRVTFGASTIRRLIKYAGQGYTMCSGCANDILKSAIANPSIVDNSTLYID